MPGPFPGMDPYLERPAVWESFHARLVIRVADQLQPLLAPRYLVRPQERIGVVFQERQFIPDVAVSRSPRAQPPDAKAVTAHSAPAGALLVRGEEVPTRQTALRIIEADTRRLVTVIEILSPTNKRGDGSRQYTRKQADVLASEAHLVEIDLLRAGKHTVAVPEDLIEPMRPFDYLACVSRASDRTLFECYAFRLRNPLPPISVPLLPADPDVELSLATVIDGTYDVGCYGLDLDYNSEPEPPLRREDREWAEALLREKGFRPAG